MSGDKTPSAVKPAGQALHLTIPARKGVLDKCILIAADPNVRAEVLVETIAEDPSVILALFHHANSLIIGGEKQSVTTIDAATTRIGNTSLLELLRTIPTSLDTLAPDVMTWLELNRERGRKIGQVSKIIAELLARPAAGEAQLAGVFCSVGDLLAVLHLDQAYPRIANGNPRSSVQYKLVQEFKFDIMVVGPQYLARQGIPPSLIIQGDADSASRDRKRAAIKPLVLAAEEFVDARERGRIDSLAPGKNFPAKSMLRILQFQGDQYARLFERVKEALSQPA